jgi:putative membrane protein
MAVTTVRILLLGIWAGFFTWMVSLGQEHLARLLHPGLWWLVISAVLILLLLLVVNCRGLMSGRRHGSIRWQWPSLAILLMPLFFFSQVQSARFDADTFSKRILPTMEGMRQGGSSLPNRTAKTESTDVSLVQLIFDADKYLGKEVEVVCQTFVNARLPKGIAMCYRYLISCCAADARPLFIFIEPPQGILIENDKWIRAKGTLAKRLNAEVEVPLLPVQSVEYVDEPAFPYVF